jgi:hypothetical protein
MLLIIIDELENKLAKFSSDSLKSMSCIHSDISNKPGLIIDHLSASTSHASDSELHSTKQDAMRKSKFDDSSSSKFVPPHRRHIKDKDNVICKNANYNSAENVKKHSSKRSLLTCHH